MKAAVYYETGAPSVFKYEDVEDPPLHPKGVVFEVKAVAIEGGDVLNRAGGELVRKPHIVGYNCAGVVREVGAEVTDRKPGDRVTALMANGSHAELASVPVTSTWIVPEGVSFEQAAAVPVAFGTAHDCIHEFGRVKAGETVLVQAGTSGVGIACVQIAKRAGATVIATSSSDEKLERLREYGMDHGVNYSDGDFVGEGAADHGRAGVRPHRRFRRREDAGGEHPVRGVSRAGDHRREREPRGEGHRRRAAVGGERVAHRRVLRAGDVPVAGAGAADDGRAAGGHREGRAEGGGRQDVPAVGGGGGARVHRVAGGVRAGGAGAVASVFGAGAMLHVKH